MNERSGYYIANPHGTHFLTFTTVGWIDIFTRKECKDIIIDALRYCIENKGLVLNAYVLMESHLHLVASAKEGSAGLSAIIRDFKRHTAKCIIDWVQSSGRESRKEWILLSFAYHAKYNKRNANYQVWQQNNQPKECLHPKFTLQKLSYIHNNPVVAKIVDQPTDYVHSSAKDYMGQTNGLLPIQVIDFGIMEGYVKT